ncbi:MAG: Crp/Fnr family transcriptional regulator [Anaerolineae bacterium]|nr:Crp/Fnr family transcriptional regulator [Anaerolineae bacterium]
MALQKLSPTVIEGLTQIPLLKDLPADLIASILNVAQRRAVEEGSAFFFQGDPAEKVYVLLEGRVKLFQLTPDGQQVLLRVIGPWSLFGAIALAHGEFYPVTAQTAQNSTALYWPVSVLMGFINKSPQLAMNALQIMAGHVQEFQDRFRELATERVERRLARAILRLTSQTGKKVPEGILLNLPITRQDLAEMTGTTLYTVSRILSQWESQGLIQSGREKIIICFPHGLVNIAEDLPARQT